MITPARPRTSLRRRALAATLALAFAATASACATATPYQPLGSDRALAAGGYSETVIAPGEWRVTFRGDALTSRETVETYMLYRAAQLAQQNGYDWFTTSDRLNETRVTESVARYPILRPWGRGWGPSWRYSRRGGDFRDWSPWGVEPFIPTDQVTSFEASALVHAGHGAPPAGDAHAFDVRTILTTLGPRVEVPT